MSPCEMFEPRNALVTRECDSSIIGRAVACASKMDSEAPRVINRSGGCETLPLHPDNVASRRDNTASLVISRVLR